MKINIIVLYCYFMSKNIDKMMIQCYFHN
jgi:hypothetical protein